MLHWARDMRQSLATQAVVHAVNLLTMNYAIVGFTVCALSGAWIAMFTHARLIGYGMLGAGLLGFAVNALRNARVQRADEVAQSAWIRSVTAIADDLSLEGYGINDVAELAHYLDAAGRDAVLAALGALPPGERSLRAAARAVEPDAYMD
jgi:hypothetical protein